MKNVGVVIPSWHYWANPFKLQPLWELYYATLIKENVSGVDVELIDLRSSDKSLSFDAMMEGVPKKDYYVFWIMKSGDSNEVESISKFLKNKFPNCKTIAGGTHVDMCLSRSLESFDFSITGPGESSLIKILSDDVITTSKTHLKGDYKIDRFDNTPFPERELLPKKSIVNYELFKEYGEIPATSIYMSRGCIYSCAFCVYNVPNELQVRSPEMLRAEIQYLKKNYGVKGINLRDEVAIHPNPKISEQCLSILKDEDILWRGQTTTLAKRQQLELAKESGCVELSVGVETVDESVMNIINKKWQKEDGIRRFFSDAKDLGIKIKVCLILGLPGEPDDIVDKTIKFLEEVDPDYASVSGFDPVPGSPIARQPEKFGIEWIDEDLSKHAHLLFRFADEEEVGLPFRYAPVGPWGKTFSREQIKDNIKVVQHWLKDRNKVY